MTALLTADRVHELISIPKRVVRSAEFGWRPLMPPPGTAPPDAGHPHHRILKIRLIEEGGREAFEIVATSNNRFSIHLRWQDLVLARLCCSSSHKVPKKLGGGRVRGPHIHYHRPGFGTAYAEATTGFTHDDVNAALAFFLDLCGVKHMPPIQEMLDLR